MASSDRLSADDSRDPAEPPVETPEQSVSAHQSSPDRYVFTEADNSDAWISTDTIVELER